MIACTSPAPTDRSIPFRISRPSASRACRLTISSIMLGLSHSNSACPGLTRATSRPSSTTQSRCPRMAGSSPAMTIVYCSRSLTDAAFEADGQELLRLDRELHRQLLQHLFAEPVDDQRQRVFVGKPALAAVEQLVLADLRGRRLAFDAGRRVAHHDTGT